MGIRYIHTNIIAKDWRKVSQFYQQVFGCVPVPPQRDLKGGWVDKLTGIDNAHITGEHLAVGYVGNAPTLEIFSYDSTLYWAKTINREGFAHIAFQVDDVEAMLAKVVEAGGKAGEIVKAEYPGNMTATFVYAQDIEGNIIELQSWQKH